MIMMKNMERGVRNKETHPAQSNLFSLNKPFIVVQCTGTRCTLRSFVLNAKARSRAGCAVFIPKRKPK